MSSQQIAEHIKKMLILGQQEVDQNPNLSHETGHINAKGDRTIGMDSRLEEIFINYLKDNSISCKVFSEEIGDIELQPNPKYYVVIDPLDGSTNYKIGRGILPFGSLIAFFEGENPKLNNVVAVGIYIYPRKMGWIYDGVTKDFSGEVIQLKEDWFINKSTPIYLDLYAEGAYQQFSKISGNLFVRNEGSTSGNLSLLLSNVAGAIGSIGIAPEEIGTVYALVKGAGGVVVNHQGEDIGFEEFSSDKKYPMLAGSKNVVDTALNLLKKD